MCYYNENFSKKERMFMEIERDIVLNSKYIISYFNKNEKDVTNLMVEKLLYFLEAIYMVMTDEDYLFNEDFYAWNFGPVSDRVYQEYKYFGNLPIILEENVNIPKKNEIYVEHLYEMFSDFSSYDLVNLSHSKGSPWYEIDNQYNDSDIPKGIKISKIDTKKWFSGLVEITSNEK